MDDLTKKIQEQLNGVEKMYEICEKLTKITNKNQKKELIKGAENLREEQYNKVGLTTKPKYRRIWITAEGIRNPEVDKELAKFENVELAEIMRAITLPGKPIVYEKDPEEE